MCYAWVFVPQPSDVVEEGLAQKERDHDMRACLCASVRVCVRVCVCACARV